MPHCHNLTRQLIEEPLLMQLLQQVAPDQFVRLVRHIGLEDAGELLALASGKQLTALFDETFWKTGPPGTAEFFDPKEFSLWLECMYEYSPEVAQNMLAEMDDDLVTLGMVGNLLVVDYEVLALQMHDARRSVTTHLLDKMLESEQCLEWGEYFLLAKRNCSWDALIAALVDLDATDPSRIQHILQRMLHITTEYIDDNGGLYAVLSSSEMLAGDLAAAREERKTKQGFVSPEAAQAFLQLTRQTPVERLKAAQEHDYLTRAYFRSFQPAKQVSAQKRRSQDTSILLAAIRSELPELFRHCSEAQIIQTCSERTLLSEQVFCFFSSCSLTSHDLFLQLAQENPECYEASLFELNYLANVLVAAGKGRGEPMRPMEAAKQTLALCDQGLTILLSDKPQATGEALLDILRQEGPIKLFQLGWHLAARVRVP